MLDRRHFPCSIDEGHGGRDEVAPRVFLVLADTVGRVGPGLVVIAIGEGDGVWPDADHLRGQVEAAPDDLSGCLDGQEPVAYRPQFVAGGVRRQPGAERVDGVAGGEEVLPERPVGGDRFYPGVHGGDRGGRRRGTRRRDGGRRAGPLRRRRTSRRTTDAASGEGGKAEGGKG